MRRLWLRIACLALLGLIAGAAASGVAKASASLAHACCPDASRAEAPSDADECRGFLPLSCCHAPALPGAESGPQAPAAVALPAALALPAEPLARFATAPAALAPPLPPSRLSVVLQL